MTVKGAILGVGATVTTLLIPNAAWAEVMDKEPTLGRIWGVALVFGLAGFFAWRRHFSLGVVVTLLAVPFVWAFHWELTDPYVGPAILHEAGRGYVLQAYAAMLACALLHLLGVGAYIIRGRRSMARGAGAG